MKAVSLVDHDLDLEAYLKSYEADLPFAQAEPSRPLEEDRSGFGLPLDSVPCSSDGVPVVVKDCINYIDQHGLQCEGLYRISPAVADVTLVRSQLAQGCSNQAYPSS